MPNYYYSFTDYCKNTFQRKLYRVALDANMTCPNRDGRWLYVGFMCHLVIEKTIKSYWSAIKPDEVPYIHNLLKLAQSCGLVSKMTSEQLKFLAELMPMNIEARYPSYKDELAKKLTPEYCRTLINKTKVLKQWIENML